MHRPIGVTILAILAALAGVFEIWRTLVFLGIVSFTFVGQTVTFPQPQWGQAIFAIILAGIWFWVASGFWNLRAYAWTFGVFISLFTIVFGFFAILTGSTVEAETVGWLISIAVFFYLNYPGVRDAFTAHEMSLLNPEQRAAMEQMQAAQQAMERASAPAAAGTPSSAPAAAAQAAAPAAAAQSAAPADAGATAPAPAAPVDTTVPRQPAPPDDSESGAAPT
jgi:hypothetical protein